MNRKVFVYVLRSARGNREILVLDSHDEPGFEVPKGGVEPGESLVQAARRELLEEAGLDIDGEFTTVRTARWQTEEQAFLRVEAPNDLPDTFEHRVTGSGIDAGLVYRYRWLPVGEHLQNRLVQGCGALAYRLLDNN